MKNSLLIFALFLITGIAVAQQTVYKVTYQQLREYQGYYEYVNQTHLTMATSPKDTVLYAILNQARYALKPVEKDVFVNNAKQPVKFIRDASGVIAGYTYADQTMKLVSRNVSIPVQMWYPRLNRGNYKYHEPAALADGLETGDAETSGLDTCLLTTMMNKIINGDYPDMHSVLIVRNGKLVFEEYFYEYTRDSLQEQRSASKSVVSALAGIAIRQGLIKSVNDPMEPYLPNEHFNNNTDLKKKITIGDLLSNQSGVSYDEAYDKAAGNETAMNYANDWVKYTFDLPMIDTPGKVGRYNSGNPITIGVIVEKTSGMPLPDFAKKNLFGPLGITHFKWRFKPDKTESEDFCQLYLRPRDMAKFGLMYLNDGQWQHKRVVPAEWIATSTSKHSVVQGVNYGYFWWLKYLDADGIRYNGIAAQGNGGQKTYIFKQQNMVVVITGGNYNTQSPSDQLIKKYILPAFNKNK